MKTALILQSQGIGDIIFSQSIAHHFIDQEYRIIWPVAEQFKSGLTRAYPLIEWVSMEGYEKYMDIQDMNMVIDDMLVVPIRWSREIMGVPYSGVMCAKFDMYGLDWQDWKRCAGWVRDHAREHELYHFSHADAYNRAYGGYVLVNEYFGSDSQFSVDINPESALPKLHMNSIEGASLFDWASVLLCAQEIHVVSSAILYILELLPITCPIHLYCRKPQELDFKNVEMLFSKPYILHY